LSSPFFYAIANCNSKSSMPPARDVSSHTTLVGIIKTQPVLRRNFLTTFYKKIDFVVKAAVNVYGERR
jgi:hypothetical protein